MRIPYSFLAVILFVILATLFHSFLDARSIVSMSYASAEVSPAVLTATSTLVAASTDTWESPQEVAQTMEEISTQTIAAPTREAAMSAKITTKKLPPPPVERPVRVIIPSIALDTRIVDMGINTKGELDVPSGSTNDVGWYAGGPKPGQLGSAVLDAHVFAAFENLRYLQVGEHIIIETEAGTQLKFVVEKSTVYMLNEISSQMLFGSKGFRGLNLITCAGSPVGDTYSHRLIVYAKFVEVI